MDRRKYGGVVDMCITLTVVMVSRVYTCVNTFVQIVQFKYVQFIVSQLYLNIKLFKSLWE